MTDETYNGWTNWETWVVNLWLTNDQETYNKAFALLKEKFEFSFERADALRDFFHDLMDNGKIRDHISLHRVNWAEIINGFEVE